MTASDTTAQRKPWFIGFAFRFTSPELKFDFLGSPLEILQQMKQANIEPAFAANHLSVEIRALPCTRMDALPIFLEAPNTPGLMQLLDSTAAKQWNRARER